MTPLYEPEGLQFPSKLSHFENLSGPQNSKDLLNTFLGQFQRFRFTMSRLEPEHVCV